MENLNDVEFGVDDNQEEAPILIAQRQLNIFRQVHIFNKAKRDQFDDELLALPDVVINYIKKMPGGRLLIEHLEDVKTKRGISFVKSKSEDFISPDDTSTPAPQVAAGVPAQYVGGSLTMDANFADTFAKSMAEAFKQMPTPTINATGAPVASGDFGQFFEMIAEEIKASRSSLLDVLKETKNITDSVIASQVSISRILEGILSSQNKGDTDTATMNNRIIASQASITKLLESLYTSNTKKNDEVSAYLDVDNKLQDFRNQLEQTISNSLNSIVNHIYDVTNKQAVDIATLDIEGRLAKFKSDLEADVLKSLANLTPVAVTPVTKQVTLPRVNQNVFGERNTEVEEKSTDFDINPAPSDINSERKKKKKKKKNNLNSSNVSGAIGGDMVASFSAQAVPVRQNKMQQQNNDQKFEGVIRNSTYRHEDNFDNVDLDVPPLEDNSLSDVIEKESQVSLPDNELQAHADRSLDDLMNDGLDYELPQQSESLPDEEITEEPVTAPQQDLSSLDDLMNDGLDYELPQQGEALPDEEIDEKPVTAPQQDLSSLDDLMDDGLDYELPQQGEALPDEKINEEPVTAPQQDLSSLDDLMNDGLDYELPQQGEALPNEEITEEPVTAPQQDLSSLDDLMTSEVKNSASTEPHEPYESETSQSDAPVIENHHSTNSEDGFVEDIEEEDIAPHGGTSATSSRYSAELDKIRAALTSDNIDISSLDEPIALDDYDDDANVSEEEEDDAYKAAKHYSDTEIPENVSPEPSAQPLSSSKENEDDWEWEYVDEDGNPVPQDENATNDEDWEWEYVEDDSSGTEDNNKPE